MVKGRIGDLDKRVEIQSKAIVATASNPFNDPNKLTWTTLATRWAEIMPVNTSEFEQADQINNESKHKIRLRFYPGLSPAHRLVCGSRVFYITGVIDVDEAGVWHMVDAIERT